MFEIRLANGKTFQCDTGSQLSQWYERNKDIALKPKKKRNKKKTEPKK